MLIFDGFTKHDAQQFAQHVKDKFHLNATVCKTQEESDQIDPFPFNLAPTIVLVDRTDERTEDKIQLSVPLFDGTFAGT